jgi:hypothetical protein
VQLSYLSLIRVDRETRRKRNDKQKLWFIASYSQGGHNQSTPWLMTLKVMPTHPFLPSCTYLFQAIDTLTIKSSMMQCRSSLVDSDASSQCNSVQDVQPDRERLIDLGFLNKLRIKKRKQNGNGEESSRKKMLGFPSMLLFPACFLVTTKNWPATVRNQRWNGTNPFFQLEFMFGTICERSLICI